MISKPWNTSWLLPKPTVLRSWKPRVWYVEQGRLHQSGTLLICTVFTGETATSRVRVDRRILHSLCAAVRGYASLLQGGNISSGSASAFVWGDLTFQSHATHNAGEGRWQHIWGVCIFESHLKFSVGHVWWASLQEYIFAATCNLQFKMSSKVQEMRSCTCEGSPNSANRSTL